LLSYRLEAAANDLLHVVHLLFNLSAQRIRIRPGLDRVRKVLKK
jgi:hypothetical protein